jgi:SAM-dependent methyltransferase
MFNLAFLSVLRAAELEKIVGYLEPGCRVLEIGGGTGQQARMLADRGCLVVSVDIADSMYAESREYPVIVFDGERLPFGDSEFDVVYSSNVLEHVNDLAALHKETKRVLRPGGYEVHVLPTTAWRFWTSVAHYVDFSQQMALALISAVHGRRPWRKALGIVVGLLQARRWPARHGERGNLISELYYFSEIWWCRHFQAHDFQVLVSEPVGIFYTGYMVSGPGLHLGLRHCLSRVLGAATRIYLVRPSLSCSA